MTTYIADLMAAVFAPGQWGPSTVVMGPKVAHHFGIERVIDDDGNWWAWNDQDQDYTTRLDDGGI